jgi:hypothetical protein
MTDEYKGVWWSLEENGRRIKQMLVSINIQQPEINAMLSAYRDSVLKREGLLENEQS